MRHRATRRLWALPAVGEVVAITSPGPKKSLDKRGQMGRFLCCQSWSNKVPYILTVDTKGRPQVKH
eukprot:5224737-Prorocentrum_lima.AAC.1